MALDTYVVYSEGVYLFSGKDIEEAYKEATATGKSCYIKQLTSDNLDETATIYSPRVKKIFSPRKVKPKRV